MGLIDGMRNLQEMFSGLSRTAAEDALTVGFDLTAKMKSRVQQEGLDSDESPFESYTPNYAKQRAKAGYQVSQVDFTRTGGLMANVRPTIVNEQPGSVTVEIGADSEENKAILRGQARKRGNIIANTQEELSDSLEDYAAKRAERLNNG